MGTLCYNSTHMTLPTWLTPFKSRDNRIEILEKEVAELYALLVSVARCSDTSAHLLALQAHNEADNVTYLRDVFKTLLEMRISQKVK